MIFSIRSAISTDTMSNFDCSASVRNGFGYILLAFLAIRTSSARRRVRCLLVVVTLHLESYGLSGISPSILCSCDSSASDSDANAWNRDPHATGLSGMDPSSALMMGACAWIEF